MPGRSRYSKEELESLFFPCLFHLKAKIVFQGRARVLCGAFEARLGLLLYLLLVPNPWSTGTLGWVLPQGVQAAAAPLPQLTPHQLPALKALPASGLRSSSIFRDGVPMSSKGRSWTSPRQQTPSCTGVGAEGLCLFQRGVGGSHREL